MQGKKAKLISSYSCFYDLPDPVFFATQVAANLSIDGLWCLEQSYMPLMLETNSFDTICHEHIEYYKLQDIKNICDKSSLEIKDIEFNKINGGSFSVTVGHPGGKFKQSSMVKEVLLNEMSKDWEDEFVQFNSRIEDLKNQTLAALEEFKLNGKSVAALGASTKGNVLLQYYGITSSHIYNIGEVNTNKLGCSTPGTNIPIVCENELLDTYPDYLLVLPWHFRDFFLKNPALKGRKLIFPLPNFEIVEVK